MHSYKSLSVMAIDNGSNPQLILSLYVGEDIGTACHARKTFDLESFGEVRDILGWAAQAFLQAADELHEDGWEIRHSGDCEDAHMEYADA